jgi:hypothetical protein
VQQCLASHSDHADARAPSGAQGCRRRLKGGAARPDVVDQNHATRQQSTRAYCEDAIHHPSPLSATERMQRRHRPGALEERCNRARQRIRRCGGNERRMIEASVAQARWVGGNRHEGCITTEILLHGTDRTL